jgi:endonuclease/exonuclease/phosphatase family metal-dependent hydrolase
MLRGNISRRAGVGAALWLLVTSAGLAEPDRAAKQGQISVVTYNVAGLPEGLSNVTPTRTLPVVGGLLNKFDLALVQEDFAYPELLRQNLRLPYQSAPFVRGQQLHFGDGLSVFSKLPLGEVTRAGWATCHGVYDSYSDCLTPKGFAHSRVELAPGVLVDLYDAHLDAGGGSGDRRARARQLDQLVEAIEKRSAGRPLLLGGDFNLMGDELPAFRKRMGALGIVDSCDELRCPEPRRLDRVLSRGSAGLSLKAKSWRLAPGFRDATGRALSDHEPVAVTLAWSTKP